MQHEQQPEQDVRGHAKIRAQFRSIVGTSFFLLVLLLLARGVHFISEKLFYVLFALVFVVDFSLHAGLIWKNKIFWLTSKKSAQGFSARMIALAYGAIALACLLFAIFALTR